MKNETLEKDRRVEKGSVKRTKTNPYIGGDYEVYTTNPLVGGD
jgi:hypothetical protein